MLLKDDFTRAQRRPWGCSAHVADQGLGCGCPALHCASLAHQRCRHCPSLAGPRFPASRWTERRRAARRSSCWPSVIACTAQQLQTAG